MDESLNKLSPKISFWAGVASGVATICAVGFIILLVMFFRGGSFGDLAIKEPTKVQAPTEVRPTAPTPQKNVSVTEVNEADHFRGDKNADVVVIEYSDTECPFCKRYHNTMIELLQKYDGRVAWVYRHFPLDSLHKKSRREAEATECAGEKGKFWEYLDELFARTPSNDGLPDSALPEIASSVGLNTDEFLTCLNSGRYAEKVESQYQDAVASGGTGTPYSVIVAGDKQIPVNGAVPITQLSAIIDSVL